jgi:Fe-S-cluster-containing hydrogenase component 2
MKGELYMDKLLIYDQEKCTGCRSCVVGCSLYHEGECSKLLSRINVVRNERYGESFVAGCDLCTDPPCAAVCPTGACALDPKMGIAKIDAAKCIGCKECLIHCPFGAISIHPITKKSFKCDLCEGRTEGPVCADWCPSGAITWMSPEIAAKAKKRHKLQERINAATMAKEVS